MSEWGVSLGFCNRSFQDTRDTSLLHLLQQTSMPSIQLTRHTVIGDQLALAWSDGQESYIALEDLRRGCPCAACQGEPDAMGRVLKPRVQYTEKSFQVLKIQQVGGYALQVTWGDRHSSGIYTFDLLRKF